MKTTFIISFLLVVLYYRLFILTLKLQWLSIHEWFVLDIMVRFNGLLILIRMFPFEHYSYV